MRDNRVKTISKNIKINSQHIDTDDIEEKIEAFSSIINSTLYALTGMIFTSPSIPQFIQKTIGTGKLPNCTCLPCTGGTVSLNHYPNLKKKMQNRELLYVTTSEEWGKKRGLFLWKQETDECSLPNLQGYFIRGFAQEEVLDEEGSPIDTARELGSIQGDAIRNITGEYLSLESTLAILNQKGAFKKTKIQGSTAGFHQGSPRETGTMVTFDASDIVPTAKENRPKNIALTYCMFLS